MRAIVNIANDSSGKPVSIRKISEAEKISAEFLEQICFRLKKAGIVRSVRGPGGGFLLARAPKAISMYDVFKAVGEGSQIASCVSSCEKEAADCRRKYKCAVHPTWNKLSREVAQLLSDYTIKTIMDDTPVGRTPARL